MEDCIFCKIINNELPSTKVYEDESFLAFRDIAPVAKTHVLLIPKKHIANLNELDDPELTGKLLSLVPKIAQKLGVGDAYRSVINTGVGVGQSVFHIHIHILGGQELSWP